jgi:hypothetical protein
MSLVLKLRIFLMPNISEESQKPSLQISLNNPELWEKQDQDNLLGLFRLLLEIDSKKNPENYKLPSKPSNLKSYESNSNIRNSNHTGKTK